MSDMELSEFGKELIDLFERHCFAPAPQLRDGRNLSDLILANVIVGEAVRRCGYPDKEVARQVLEEGWDAEETISYVAHEIGRVMEDLEIMMECLRLGSSRFFGLVEGEVVVYSDGEEDGDDPLQAAKDFLLNGGDG